MPCHLRIMVSIDTTVNHYSKNKTAYASLALSDLIDQFDCSNKIASHPPNIKNKRLKTPLGKSEVNAAGGKATRP